MVAELQGAIIAAGSGERLRKAAGGIPKPLVEIAGDTMLSRQSRALLGAGAGSVVAVINSETARLIDERRAPVPRELSLIVRDTANSMESLFALGEKLTSGLFLLTTVDAMIPPHEFMRFKDEAIARIEAKGASRADAAIGVTRWRGDKRPLFAKVTKDGLIAQLGAGEAPLVTAGIYMLPTRIFQLAGDARHSGLDALRRFLALLIEREFAIGAIEIAGAIDVDEAPDLEAARRAIEENK
ncbi:MAG TPA: NTP transferase domain-containing protein [Candidatus Binataceae bacterium]|nr:NTP transferase domain-containing protein [Candidatus Binataceae bacterium]